MKTRNTLILVGIFALLVFCYYLFEIRGTRLIKKQKEQEEKLLSLGDAPVDEVRIARREGEPIVLRKTGGQWRVEAPIQAPADQAAVSDIIDAARNAKFDRVAGEGTEGRDEFGLDPPEVTLTLGTEGGGKAAEVAFGDKNPLEPKVYAAVEGDPRILLVDAYLKSAADKDLLALRERRVIPFESGEAARIEIETGGARLVLGKNQGRWILEAPFRFPADQSKVSDLEFNLRELRAEAFAAETADDPADYGLDAPATVVTVTLEGKETPLKLAVGRSEHDDLDKVYAQSGSAGPVVVLARKDVTGITPEADSLASKKLAEFWPYQVKKLVVAVKDKAPITVVKGEEGDYRLVSPEAHDTDRSKVDDLLDAIRTAEVAVVPGGVGAHRAAYGLGAPAVTVTLTTEGSQVPQTFMLGKRAAKGRVFAAVTGFDVALTAPGDLLDTLSGLEPSSLYPTP